MMNLQDYLSRILVRIDAGELDTAIDDLLEAWKLTEFVPDLHFRIGAAIYSLDPRLFSGPQEHASAQTARSDVRETVRLLRIQAN